MPSGVPPGLPKSVFAVWADIESWNDPCAAGYHLRGGDLLVGGRLDCGLSAARDASAFAVKSQVTHQLRRATDASDESSAGSKAR